MPETNQTLNEIILGDIRPNQLNPRKDFAGPNFDDLVMSVRQNGVVTPILVRPIDDLKSKFEIVYGERRFRAMCKISAEKNGGIETLETIPALIRDLDDDTAFDIMTIENLQRNDLTKLEEAESFYLYVERHGDDSVEGLAERVGCSPKYIRRRAMVMRLPNYIRKAWGDRVIKFGHLEQLAKITGDATAVKNVYNELIGSIDNGYNAKMWTVGEFRTRIENASPPLSSALFDIEGCAKCFNNSSVQKSLFDMGEEIVSCTRPKCFREQQGKWLADTWPEFRKKHKAGTNGFRFNVLCSYGEWHHCPDRITAECKKCEFNVSLLEMSGEIHTRRVCVGDEDCIARQNKVGETTDSSGSGASSAAGSGDDDGGESAGNNTEPRVAWHGHHFRQMFYAEQLPIRAKDFDPNDTEMLHLYLFLLVKNIGGMTHWLFEYLNIDEGDSWDDKGVFAVIEVMSAEKVIAVMKAAAIQALVKDVESESQAEYYGAPRQLFAKHLGIDLGKQWAITQDYVSKKTRDELLNQGDELGIFDQDKVKQYIIETMQKDPEKVRSFKKGEIAKIILESGADLIGLVPAEILDGVEG